MFRKRAPRDAKEVRGDQAGLAVMKTMARAAGAAPHIEIREGLRVRALLRDGEGRITGVLTEGVSGLIEIAAPATILASGGSCASACDN